MIINNLSKMVFAPDFHKGPDLTHENLIHEKPALTRTAEDINPKVELVHTTLGRVILDTSKLANIILTQVSTKDQLQSLDGTLNGVEKSKFIEKLKQLPDYKGSKVESAIEKGTVEIKKIPDRDIYAIYESKTGNLIYLTELDGSRYLNVDYFRTRPGYEDGLISGYIREGYGKIELDAKTGLWKLYGKEGNEIDTFSNEYATATLNAVNVMIDIANSIMEEAKKRRKEGRIN